MSFRITPANIVQKVILLASGAPGSEEIQKHLLGLYDVRGDWSEVALVVDSYMNDLMQSTGKSIDGMVQFIAENGLGLTYSDTEAGQVTQNLMGRGIDSWSELFVYIIGELDGEPAHVLDNRAEAALGFTDMLVGLGKNSDYDGSQALNAAREWVRGIDASEESQVAASEAATGLIARFFAGNVQGTVLDGYVSGATVFIDANGNGALDAGERSVISDDDGNFLFEGGLPAGNLIAQGGTDLATGQSFTGTLTAPGGAVVITPLTTLVQQMLAAFPEKSIADVEQIIFSTLGVNRVDLSSYDPLSTALNPDTSLAEQVEAVSIQAATSQIVNFLNVATALMNNLAPGNSATAQSTVSALVEAMVAAAANEQTLDLSNPVAISALLKQSTVSSGIVTEFTTTEEAARIEALAEQAGKSLEGINAMTRDAANSFASQNTASVIDALSDVFKLQTLTQTELAPAIQNNTVGDLGAVVQAFSGANLMTIVDHVIAGNLDSQTPSNDGSITNGEVAAPAPDISPPAALSISLASDTGNGNDGITSASTIVISAPELDAVWQYRIGDTGWILGAGSSFDVEGDGEKTVHVRQTDRAGNISAETSLSFTLDTAVPASITATLASDTGNNSDSITSNRTINISATESGAIWEYSLDGSSWNPGTGSSFAVEGDGEKTVHVRQTDVAGNVSTPTSLSFTLDTESPAAPSVILANDTGPIDNATTDGTVNVGGMEDGASWQYSSNNGSSWTTGTGSSFTITGGGEVKVLVRQMDRAGNVSDPAGLNFMLQFASLSLGQLNGINGFSLTGVSTKDKAGIAVSGAGDVNGDGYDDLIVGAWEADPNGSNSGSSYVVFGQPSGFTSTFDLSMLNGSNGFRLDGAAANDQAGSAVSSAGDVNGDGYHDLIVGAFGADPNGTHNWNEGSSYVVFGKASGFAATLNLSTLEGSNGYRLDGVSSGDQSGRAVSSAGDINGDGYDDLLIGAIGPNGRAGNSYVVFGQASEDAPVLALLSLNGANGFRLVGVNEEDYSGRSVSNAGDVNGDGYDDLIVGADVARANGLAGAGSSYVVFGKASGFNGTENLSELNGDNAINGFRIDGAATDDAAGMSVSAAGDVNGDGFADLIIGAPQADPNGSFSGSSYVVFGKTNFTSNLNLSTLNVSDGFRIDGVKAVDMAGISVSDAGDFNGDGYDDLLVGARGADQGGLSSGNSYVIYGKASGFDAVVNLSSLDGSNGFRLVGAAAGDASGGAVSAAGDINGDGFADLIVGAAEADSNGKGSSGASYVIFGGNYTRSVTHLGTAGDDTVTGTSGADYFVTGDGKDMLISGGGADVLIAGAGDDSIQLMDLNFSKIDGGRGHDAIVITGESIAFNLADHRGKISGIERIDLTGSGNNSLALTPQDLRNLSDTSNRLFVDGDNGDSVSGISGWSHDGSDGGYTMYSQGTAVILVGVGVSTDYGI